ncbi:MAG TPA: hypothetical protein VFR24_23035 [Candidatus Angelobacter sp.]|nr:hypothetical protein [Candidatus Angelobacter sp.]
MQVSRLIPTTYAAYALGYHWFAPPPPQPTQKRRGLGTSAPALD